MQPPCISKRKFPMTSVVKERRVDNISLARIRQTRRFINRVVVLFNRQDVRVCATSRKIGHFTRINLTATRIPAGGIMSRTKFKRTVLYYFVRSSRDSKMLIIVIAVVIFLSLRETSRVCTTTVISVRMKNYGTKGFFFFLSLFPRRIFLENRYHTVRYSYYYNPIPSIVFALYFSTFIGCRRTEWVPSQKSELLFYKRIETIKVQMNILIGISPCRRWARTEEGVFLTNRREKIRLYI